MGIGCRRVMKIFSMVLVVFTLSCATTPKRSSETFLSAVTLSAENSIFGRFSPVFLLENTDKPYNRIGTPTVALDESTKEPVVVDPDKSAVYVHKSRFETAKGIYTNLIYRIHFQKVPFGIIPFYLGAGKNVGLIVVVTLNSRQTPVLYTTVHTCGCYLAFIPTSFLPESSLPDNWNIAAPQKVYGEILPGILNFDNDLFRPAKAMIQIRDGTHRVKAVEPFTIQDTKRLAHTYAEMQPLASLEALPAKGGQTLSFYEESGPRKGYVKGSHKPLERLLMSWWSFDWRVGEDKKLGKDKTDGIVFYTSLKPWAREKSDMRDFPAFLHYWGWKL